MIYCRLSVNRDGKAANVREQEADCREYADEHGLPIVGLYCDDGRSASDKSHARRDDFAQMVGDLKAGKFAGILASTLDRLYRRPRELEDILDPVEQFDCRVRIYTVDDEKEWKLDTPSGRKELRDYVAAAAWYSDDVAAKVRKKARHRAREGRRNGGAAGYGFSVRNAIRDGQGNILEYEVVTFNEDQFPYVRDMFARVLEQNPARSSVRSICRDFNAEGIPTRDGKRWHTGSMHKILTNPAVAGLIRHPQLPELVRARWGTFVDSCGQHPGSTDCYGAIVSECDWRAVQGILSNPQRRTNMIGNIRTALLSGFIYCGKCGQKLSATRDQRGKRVYVCRPTATRPGCGKVKRQADPIDKMVAEAVIAALEDAENFTIPLDDDDDFGRLYAQKKELEDDQAQLAIDHYRLKRIGRVEYFAANDVLVADIAAVQRKLDRATSHRHLKEIPAGDLARPEWDAHGDDLAWRRELVGTLIDRVIVRPTGSGRPAFNKELGGRLDPDSVEIIPHQRAS